MAKRAISLRRNSSAHEGWKGFLLGAQVRSLPLSYTFEAYIGLWVFRIVRYK